MKQIMRLFRLSLQLVPAVVIVIALLAAGCDSSSTSARKDDPGTNNGCPPPSNLGTSLTDLLETALGGVAKGAGGALGTDLYGWVLGAVGVSGGSSEALNEIADELNEIEETLADICNELYEINTDLLKLTCATDADWLNITGAQIDDWYNQYLDFITDTQQGSPPPQSVIETWVADVLDADTGAFLAINQLQDYGVTSTSAGTIDDCISAQTSAKGKPDPGTLDDRPYYESIVAPIQNWFYGYNTKAYTVLVEAYHYKAWLAAGSPTGDIDSTLPDICDSSEGSASYYCTQAQTTYTNQVLPFLTDQIAVGGAPYSTDEYVIVNGNDWLIATNLEAYTAAAGGDCSSPLLSTDLCGPLVVEPTEPIPSVQYGAYGSDGQGTWKKTTAERFNVLLTGFHELSDKDDATTAAGWLCRGTSGSTQTTDCNVTTNYGIDAAGLENANKIVVFNKQTDSYFGSDDRYYNPLTVWCFFDGSATRHRSKQPWCDNDDGQNNYTGLMERHSYNTVPSSCPNSSDAEFWLDMNEWTRTTGNGLVSDSHFYHGVICGYANQIWNPTDYPGYAVTDTSTPKSYAWPSLEWTNLTCTDALSTSLEGKKASVALNPGGVPTMCGNDYRDWLLNILPIVGESM